MTRAPPPPVPFPLSDSATTERRDDFVAALAFDDAAEAFFFFATDDARAEAPRPAMRRTVGLVASSELFFFAAIFFPNSEACSLNPAPSGANARSPGRVPIPIHRGPTDRSALASPRGLSAHRTARAHAR